MLYAEKPTYLLSTEIFTLMKPLPMLIIHFLILYYLSKYMETIDLVLNSEVIKQ